MNPIQTVEQQRADVDLAGRSIPDRLVMVSLATDAPPVGVLPPASEEMVLVSVRGASTDHQLRSVCRVIFSEGYARDFNSDDNSPSGLSSRAYLIGQISNHQDQLQLQKAAETTDSC